MSQQAAIIRDFDSAQDQPASLDQPVDVISDAYAKTAHNSFSARIKSSGVVILMLFADPSTTATGNPRRSTRNESSVGADDGKPAVRASSFARSSRPYRNACGVCARQILPRSIVRRINPFSTSLIVSVAGMARIAAPISRALAMTAEIRSGETNGRTAS